MDDTSDAQLTPSSIPPPPPLPQASALPPVSESGLDHQMMLKEPSSHVSEVQKLEAIPCNDKEDICNRSDDSINGDSDDNDKDDDDDDDDEDDNVKTLLSFYHGGHWSRQQSKDICNVLWINEKELKNLNYRENVWCTAHVINYLRNNDMTSWEEKWKEIEAESTQWLISQLHERQNLEMLFKEIELPKSGKKQDDKRLSKLRLKRFRIFACDIL
ncbi:probable ribosome production factor 1 [Mytilus californianus]|uniref:probable ribosome production factor 1 n=1 Tax=Mytilus californianus TaxID=6549 RepID=UPI002247A38A|nr:probable ribosome production factor 1 [Mytilus californianus]